MTEKYVQLMEDLQYSRRQAQNWKQKHSILEQQLHSAHQENQELKKTVNRLQQTNSRLAEVNRQLTAEKQSILTDYSEEVSSIKQEIAKKQQQIQELKQSTSPTLINHELAIRQLKFQLTDSFQKQSASQEKKIQELTALLQRHNYEKEIEKEKSILKIKTLENSIREMQQKHQQEIAQYSTKLFQATQVRPPEERELLRKTKRQNEQLKKRLDLANSDLSAALEQKNQVHKDYAKWMKEHQKIITDHQNEILTYKAEITRITALMDQNSNKRDEMILKDKDRDIKRLKAEAEELRDQILSKEQKISEMEVEKAKLQAEIKTMRSQQLRQLLKVQQASQWERDRLQKEIIEARYTLEKLKGQNLQLNDRIYQASRATSEQRKKFDDFKKEQQQQRNHLKRQLSQQNLRTSPQQKPPTQPTNQNEQEIKQLQEAFRNQKGKLRQFLTKYIDLKKKYDSVQRKLRKANQKIMELLQTKIILGSPKASTQKHFQFPTEPRTEIKISPPPRNPPNIPNRLGESRNQVISSLKEQDLIHTANFKPPRHDHDQISKTNPAAFYPKNYMNSPPNKNMRIEDEEGDANEHSYYEKSLKLKTQQFKQLKCTNHQHS